MIAERKVKCQECGKEIVTKGNWFNQMFIRQLHDWACEIHMRKAHGKRLLKWRYIPVSIMEIVIGIILRIIMTLLWGVTLPFWIIHEFCE